MNNKYKKIDKKNVAEVIKEIESFVATHIYTQLNPIIMIGPTGKFAAGQFVLGPGLFKRRRHYFFYFFSI